MAVVLPVSHERLTLNEIRARKVVSTGQLGEIKEHIEQANRSRAANVATSLALLQIGPAGIQHSLNTGSFTVISQGSVRLVNDAARLQVKAYGSEVEVQVLFAGLGFQGLASIPGAALTWGSSAVFSPIGATLDAEGVVFFVVLAKLLASGGKLEQVGVSELPQLVAALPDGSAAFPDTFVAMDSTSLAADRPLDSWAVQQIDTNAGSLGADRSRRHLHMLQSADEYAAHTLSSCRWRLDGPYGVASQPWADSALVVVTGKARAGVWNEDVDITVLSELEQLSDQAVQDRIISAAPGVLVNEKFNVPIKHSLDQARAGESTRIWIAYRSKVKSAPEAPSVGGGFAGYGGRAALEDVPMILNSAPGAYGICLLARDDDSTIGKPPSVLADNLPYQNTTAMVDLACVVGLRSGTSPGDHDRMDCLISPAPTTGLDGGSFLDDPSALTPDLEGFYMGVFDLYGIYIEPRLQSYSRQRIARAGDSPRSSFFRGLNHRLNQQANMGTPAISSRHPGSANVNALLTIGLDHILYAGRYLYLSGGVLAVALLEWDVPILADPNGGAVSGLLCDEVFATLDFLVVHGFGPQIDEPIDLEFQAIGASAGDAITYAAQVWPGSPNPATGVTHADACTAANATEMERAATPAFAVANTYNQEATWGTEGQRSGTPWTRSPTFSCDLPVTYPGFVKIKASIVGGLLDLRGVNVIISGCSMHFGPRK